MKVVTLTRGGQISIPAEFRRGWTSGRVVVRATEDGLLVRPLPDDPIAVATGYLKGKGRSGLTSEQAMAELRSDESVIEKRKWSRVRP
jgi:bifunctional DNA-binding transcriptional regulator/antitoxin component of YhaV-PrlF toxin-antitoxin module